MPTREELHKLIDTMPEGAIEAAHRMLSNLQVRRHLGHELTVSERIRVDGQRLIYKHEITGPGEKRDEREIVFDL